MAEFEVKAAQAQSRRMSAFPTDGGNNKASIKLTASDIEYVRSGGATHTWSQEEKIAFSSHINYCLAHDAVATRHLPLDIDSVDLFERSHDGLILCKLINLANPDTIDERALNVKESLNVYQKTENINLALNAAKSIGCQVVNIGAQDIIDGKPILILGLVWQIIKIQLLSQISLKNFPELVVLLEEGETLGTFVKLAPEAILTRWVNYHLARANFPRRIANFGHDIQDSEVYSVLMHQVKPAVCRLITATDPLQRATQAITTARQYGVEPFIQAKDICDGNKKLNMSFVAQMFNTFHGLTITEEEKATFDLSSLEMDDAGDSREERVLRMWINSLNIDEVYVNNLFADLDDGLIILKLADVINPGCVEWRRVNKVPTSRYKKVENANMAVTICSTALRVSVVNVGGLDIVDGRKKMILSIISQLMRKYTLQVLSALATSAGTSEMSEDQIVLWANETVSASGKRGHLIRNFKDKSLSTGIFFLELVNAIEPQAVDWSVVTSGTTEEEKSLNAKYGISCARKLGACVFLTHEDVTEVKTKMIVTYVASIWMAAIQR